MRTLHSGWYVLGKECKNFEESFKQYLINDDEGFVIGVNSGTDALKLSLLAAGVRECDEVITVANTAIPTATAICSIGAVPVFCDVDPGTWLINPAEIESCITKKTKAIISVHLYGAPCEMKSIANIAERYNLAIIEDVAQAVGAEYEGKKCGTIGDFGAFSFYPTKNLGACGDGGAIFVKNSELRDILVKLRNYGQSTRYVADRCNGVNSRLDEIQAAILSAKLPFLEKWNNKRRELYLYYQEKLINTNLPLKMQSAYSGSKSANHLLVIKVEPEARHKLIKNMDKKGIEILIHYPKPLYMQPAFAVHRGEKNIVSEYLCSSVLSLPLHQHMSFKQIDYVIECLKECLLSAR